MASSSNPPPAPPRRRRSVADWIWFYGKRVRRLGEELGLGLRYSLQPGRRRRPPAAVRFVIYGVGRVGSELLVELLDNHPRLRCDAEILDLPLIRPLRYANLRSALAESPVYGFKLLTHHMLRCSRRRRGASGESFLHRLHRDGWRILHLRRRDRLRQAVSVMASQQRKHWHHRQGDGRRPQAVQIDVPALLQRLDFSARRQQEELAALGDLPRLELFYEDHLKTFELQQATARRVFQWLDLEPVPVSTSLVPSSPRRLEDFIANYDEVERALRGAGLDDLLPPAAAGNSPPSQPYSSP
ncbi:MAG: Stf0 family sulfotransferase [Acidobacteriota bacterium]|nr:Stf0 family sulfotransferase [Acidobacteriota bacterium]